MKIATIQLAINDEESKEEKIRRVETILQNLKEVDLVLLPELWNVGFFSFDKYREQAETLSGETLTRLCKMAKKIGAYIFTGSFVEKREENYFNTCALIDKQGKLVGNYSKMHLFGYGSAEREILSPGKNITVVDTEFGKIGLSICYDIRFPELYRKMVDKGAEIMINCAAWPYPRVENWTTLNIARAIENQSYFLSCVCAGASQGKNFIGRSMVIDPWGTVVSSAGERETVMMTEIHPEQVVAIREDFTPLKDRVIYF